jgi:hypothetical protein
MHRRALLRWLVSGAAAWPLRGIRLHAQAAALSDSSVPLLRALAPVVLPSALGAAGHNKVVGDFVQWLASYRSGAERNWGYGHPRKNVTPAIDAAAYQRQLNDLDQLARVRGSAFASLPLDARSAIVFEVLDSIKARTLPGAPTGAHVVTDFMSFYFSSAAANDLVYRARIGRTTCRGLTGADGRPSAVSGD